MIAELLANISSVIYQQEAKGAEEDQQMDTN